MAPVMAHVDPEEPWSPCSARFITDFLDNGYGKQMALCRMQLLPLTVLPLLLHPTWAKLTASNMLPVNVGWDEKRCCFWFPLPLRMNSTTTGGKFWPQKN